MIKKLVIIFIVAGVLFYSGLAGKIFNHPITKKLFGVATRVALSAGKAAVDAGLKETGLDNAADREQIKKEMTNDIKKAYQSTKDTLTESLKESSEY